MHCLGGVPAGGGGVHVSARGGVYLPGGVPARRECTCLGGGVFLPGGGVPARGGYLPSYSPVNRITDSCKNMTFPQLRLRAVKYFHCV